MGLCGCLQLSLFREGEGAVEVRCWVSGLFFEGMSLMCVVLRTLVSRAITFSYGGGYLGCGVFFLRW